MQRPEQYQTLGEFVDRIEDASDGKITGDGFSMNEYKALGFHRDSVPYLLADEADNISQWMREHPSYTFIHERDGEDEFHWRGGTALVRVRPWIGFPTAPLDDETERHTDFQQEHFSSEILLMMKGYIESSLRDEEAEAMSRHKRYANVFHDVAVYCTENDIALCFPHARPKADIDLKDTSRIMYYFPSEESELVIT